MRCSQVGVKSMASRELLVFVSFAALPAAAGASAAIVLSMQLQTAGASRKRPFVRHEEYYE